MKHVIRMAPSRFLAESGAIRVLSEYISNVSVLAVAGKTAWECTEGRVRRVLEGSGCFVEVEYVGRQCYQELAERLANRAKGLGAAWVVGVGGGKVMDLVKLVAELAALPVALVPTTSATCACWTSLSVVYDDEGKNPSTRELRRNPDLVVADYDILRSAPARYVVAGTLDALAKWYEISSTSDEPGRQNPAVLTALATAKFCRDLLFKSAPEAVARLARGEDSQALKQTIWANLVLPGVASGLVDERYRFSVAHAFYNNLTRIENARRTSLHGEQVAFGIAAQMLLERRDHPELEEFLELRKQLDAPLTLEELGVQKTDLPALREVVAAIVAEPGIASLPFTVTEENLWEALQEIDQRGIQARRTGAS